MYVGETPVISADQFNFQIFCGDRSKLKLLVWRFKKFFILRLKFRYGYKLKSIHYEWACPRHITRVSLKISFGFIEILPSTQPAVF
jgi:hypothetical protein